MAANCQVISHPFYWWEWYWTLSNLVWSGPQPNNDWTSYSKPSGPGAVLSATSPANGRSSSFAPCPGMRRRTARVPPTVYSPAERASYNDRQPQPGSKCKVFEGHQDLFILLIRYSFWTLEASTGSYTPSQLHPSACPWPSGWLCLSRLHPGLRLQLWLWPQPCPLWGTV